MLGLGSSRANYRWNPTGVGASLKLWLRNGVGATVASWEDSSDNGNNAGQTNTDHQAALSKGGLAFSVSEDDHYDLEDIVIGAEEGFSIFIVCIFDSYTNQNSILGTQNDNIFLEFQTNRKIRFKTSAGTDSIEYPVGTFATGGNGNVFCIQRESGGTGNINLFKNSADVTPTSQKANSGPVTFNRLAARDGTSLDRTFHGTILELLCYDTLDLTGSEILKINDYLKNKHGI